jgi:phosphoadenosine phosphosulfate reductase
MNALQEWAEKLGFPEEWSELGFWRWKSLPKGQQNLIKKLDLNIRAERESPSDTVELEVTKGVSPCTSAGFSLEGSFGPGIDLERISKLAPIFGKTRYSEDLGALRIKAGENSVSIFSSGSVVLRGDNEKQIERLSKQLERAVKRALFCQACGSCVPQCSQEALHLREGKVAVDAEKCINCLECDDWPCPTYLS